MSSANLVGVLINRLPAFFVFQRGSKGALFCNRVFVIGSFANSRLFLYLNRCTSFGKIKD